MRTRCSSIFVRACGEQGVVAVLLSSLQALLPGGRLLSPGVHVFMLAVVGALHLLAIYLFVILERRFLIRQGADRRLSRRPELRR